MAEIDVAVFAFDDADRLRLVNRAGERLLAQPAERLVGRTAEELGLAACLDAKARPRSWSLPLPGGTGRWEVRRSAVRQRGLPHPPARARGRQPRAARGGAPGVAAADPRARARAEQLARADPVRSPAASRRSSRAEPRPHDWEEDLRRGLAVIGARAGSLSRFMEAYARLARLPRPGRRRSTLGALVRRVAGLETRLAVRARAAART